MNENNFPVQSFSKSERVVAPSPSRALVFDTEKQRNTQYLNKGLSKPGRVTFEVLRRAVQSTHIARICVNTLKEKITKTKWVIKMIDRNKTPDQENIDTATEFFKHPNLNDETFRTFLDKILEDLLILDVGCAEKTRYPDGELAELHYVDGSTIRPVFDAFGNQDIEIPMTTQAGQVLLPVSYVQIMDNSQYGGPESGQVVASWCKKDFLRFMMHPQGAMNGIGYGLSPIESVVSVVSNILNADNFNAIYFEEGSFPPVIIQLLGQVNQRDIQLYREYLQSELAGNFHRPAIMAGGTDAKVLNLKDITNRDMEFMEYMKFMARLLAAAYGLSGQDIGLTDEIGSKNVSETQRDISNDKGYGSILHLLKEVFNQEIIWKDFGFTDLEFDWVLDDTIDPKDAADIHTKNLQAGIMTVNEAREKSGFEPYESWADEPMVLTADGYKPMIASEDDGEEGSTEQKQGTDSDDKAEDNKKQQKIYDEEENAKEKQTDSKKEVVGGERPYSEQDSLPDKKKSIFSRIKSMFENDKEPDFHRTPVMFGDLITSDGLRSYVEEMFHANDVQAVKDFGLVENGHTYNFENAKFLLIGRIQKHPGEYGGIIRSASPTGGQYTVFIKELKK